jgi:outer membrane protein insertion porin family
VKVVVAVLPFRVHSAQPLGYLERSLADLLTARLEASGRVQVLESLVVGEALLGYAAGELTEVALRRLASELGADFVVAGSLTELADRFSLDVRVTPVGREVATRNLVFTAHGEDELLERMNELADRILEIVSGASPRAVVAEVRLLGAEQLDEEARARLRVRPGSPYESGAAAEDLAMLRNLPGVATATVETERQRDGVVVMYRVIPAERLLGVPEVPVSEDLVAEVQVRGNRRIETNAILARVSIRPGDPFDPARIAEDVREIHGLGFFRNVQVISEESIDGRILIFDVEENPVVRQVTLAGNESIDGDKIRDVLTITTGATLDLPLLFENTERIEALYRADGYYLAEVHHEIEPLPGDAVAIHFEVTENRKLRLREIRFEGNEFFTDKELSQGLRTKPWRFYSYVTKYLDHSGTYAEPVFQQDLQSVSQKYMDAGFIQVEVSEPDVRPEAEGLVVIVRVVEGDRYRVGKLDVRGDDTVDLDALRERLSLKEEEYFNRSHLTADVERLTDFYTNRGFYFANVEPRTQISEENLEVNVTFLVEKGSLYFIDEIDIAGNTTTIDPVIRREMQMVEGQLYSARAIQLSRARIQRLGFFEEVNFEPQQTDYPDQLDLDVKVVERPTGSLSFGAGFSSQDGFVVSGSLAQSNLFGRGYGAQVSADIGGDTTRYFVSFSDPYFLGSQWSMGVTGFSTEVEFEDFESEASGVDLSFGRSLDEANRTRGFVRYSFSNRKIKQPSGINAASLIFREVLQGEESTSLLGVAFRTDTRNDRVAPTRGYQLSGGLEFAGLGGFSEFLRLESRVAWYTPPPGWLPSWFPFRDRSTFMLGARAGWTVPFNTIDDYDLGIFAGPKLPKSLEAQALNHLDDDLELPLTERYFLGGLGTFQLRGFKARSVGPRRAILKRTGFAGVGTRFTAVGRELAFTAEGEGRFVCNDTEEALVNNQGNGNGKCNSIYDTDIDDFDDLDETDVIGGNKFLSLTTEYRFPIAESLGLMGILFLDVGNAFAEDENLFDIGKWRYGTGFGALWFSPFGPLQAFVGFPLDKLDDGVEDGVVFEFSVGGANL